MLKKTPEKLKAVYCCPVPLVTTFLKNPSVKLGTEKIFIQKNIAPKVPSNARHSEVLLYLPRGKALMNSTWRVRNLQAPLFISG